MANQQPRDLIDPDRTDKDDKLPNYTETFDRDGGIKRYESVNQKTNDLQDTETLLGKSGQAGGPLHPHDEDEGLDLKGGGG